MQTISSAARAALSASPSRPLYLVELQYSPVSRLSSFGTVPWNGNSWVGSQSLSVSGIFSDGTGRQTAKLRIGNTDDLFGALVLNQGGNGIAVTIWSGDASEVSEGADLLQVFGGVITSVEGIGDEFVTLGLASAGSGTLSSPRRRICAATGFNTLMPSGTVIRFGGNNYVIKRK